VWVGITAGAQAACVDRRNGEIERCTLRFFLTSLSSQLSPELLLPPPPLLPPSLSWSNFFGVMMPMFLTSIEVLRSTAFGDLMPSGVSSESLKRSGGSEAPIALPSVLLSEVEAEELPDARRCESNSDECCGGMGAGHAGGTMSKAAERLLALLRRLGARERGVCDLSRFLLLDSFLLLPPPPPLLLMLLLPLPLPLVMLKTLPSPASYAPLALTGRNRTPLVAL